MAVRTRSRVTPKYKTKYRVTNWPEYEASLVQRGDITVWFNADAVEAWNAQPSGLPGGQRRYSDLAILTALTLRTVFGLPLRQAEGFLASVIHLMGVDLRTPDHTTLSRRNRSVAVPRLPKAHEGPIQLIVDSTGLKITGVGPWHAHKHQASNRRRGWRKLHLGVDAEGFILASQLTESTLDDASVGVRMIEEVEAPIGRFSADGAYDTVGVYTALAASGEAAPQMVIPPRRTAACSQPPDPILKQRDVAIRRIAEVGRRQWRKESGAHQQARAENAIFRYKRVSGDRLRVRNFEAQQREAMIAVNVLNRMAELGMPECEVIER